MKVVENCPIIIEGRILSANLVVFKMLSYDVILGMDWLSKHQANIVDNEYESHRHYSQQSK
jgi:hypothetical protein